MTGLFLAKIKKKLNAPLKCKKFIR